MGKDGPMTQIPVFKPLLEDEELAAAQRALEMGWLGMGSYVSEFEQTLSSLIEAEDRYVAAVSTGHAALHLAFLLAGIGRGDEVITASFNNIADLQAILATGAEPVFCDIDSHTLCIAPDAAEALISERTKAIIAMDYACSLCDHDAINALAAKYQMRVVHDAAHSLGSRWKEKAVGSFSDLTIFSFDPVKTITTIDGGAIVVKSKDELEAISEMRLIGMGQPSAVMYQNRRAWTYDVKRLGFRYHLANLHAAIGLAQLGKFERIASTRRDAFRYYLQHLGGLQGLRCPSLESDDTVPFLFYVLVLDDRREALREFLRSKGIDTGIHWQPGHHFSLFRNFRTGPLENTEGVGRQIVSLPFHSAMERAMQDRVIDAILSFYRR